MNESYNPTDTIAYEHWQHGEIVRSIEALGPALDKYQLADFARDDFPRFLSLIDLLSPRDAEIMLCFAVLQKRPTDLSILFGKAGHRAEEDLHKAAHKLAGLVEFGTSPEVGRLDEILRRQGLHLFSQHSLAVCLWQYSRCRDFGELSKLCGTRGFRQQMLRCFKILHAAPGREEGLLAGWILWLVDGSDPKGKGWRKRKRSGREHKLGPTTFHCLRERAPTEKEIRWRSGDRRSTGRATGRGGQGQRPDTVKITRKIKFLLRGTNA
jgi:hypothetical protein